MVGWVEMGSIHRLGTGVPFASMVPSSAVSGPNGEIVDSDIDRVIEAASAISLPASREIVHVLPREFVVDGESGVKDPVSMSGVRLEVDTHVVTASNAAVKNLTRTLQEAGVKIDDMVFSGLASATSTLTETEKELGRSVISKQNYLGNDDEKFLPSNEK